MRSFAVFFAAVGAVACLTLMLIAAKTDGIESSPVSLEVQSKAKGYIWGYSGPDGPKTWKGECKTGRKQSPINIVTNTRGAADSSIVYDPRLTQPVWEFDYGKKEPTVVFNGYTVQVTGNYATLSFDNHDWELKKIEFHSPSEHQINGVSFPVEMQMVHVNAEGRSLVVVWFFDADGWSPAYIPQLADHFPATFDGAAEYNHPVPGPNQVEFNEFVSLLVQRERKGHMFYTYQGSITSPPCTEGVTYLVMTEMIGISDNDIKKLKQIEGKNNRPVQPLNGRVIYKSFASS